MLKQKKGQVTIFIILAVLIVSGVLVFFLWVKPTYITPTREKLNFEDCIKDVVETEIENLGIQAGFVEPEFYYLYQDNKLGYLCYTNLYHELCVVQKPFLKQHFEKELKKAAREEIESCYENSIEELKRRGFDVVTGELSFNISLEPNKVNVHVESPISIVKQTGQRFEEFDIEIISPLYDILMIAQSILQFELTYGDVDVTSLMIYYPDLIIDKLKQGDGTTLYIIEDKLSKTKFQFASRSLVFPPGYGLGTD